MLAAADFGKEIGLSEAAAAAEHCVLVEAEPLPPPAPGAGGGAGWQVPGVGAEPAVRLPGTPCLLLRRCSALRRSLF